MADTTAQLSDESVTGTPGWQALESLALAINRIPYWLFGFALWVVVLLHTGFRGPWIPDAPFLDVAANWPSGSSWDSSIGWILLPTQIGLSNSPAWSLMWATLACATAAFTVYQARKLFTDGRARILLAGLAASAVPTLLLTRLGYYDEMLVIGGLLMALSRRWCWVLGVGLMALANPELALVASISFGLVALGYRRRWTLWRAVSLFGISVLCIGLVRVAQMVHDTPTQESRIELLSSNLGASLDSNVQWLPTTLGTVYAGGWLLVLLLILTPTGVLGRSLVGLGLVIVPVTAMLVTLDGTRVAVAVSGASYVVALREWLVRSRLGEVDAISRRRASILTLGLVLLTVSVPAVTVFVVNPALDWVAPFRDAIWWLTSGGSFSAT